MQPMAMARSCESFPTFCVRSRKIRFFIRSFSLSSIACSTSGKIASTVSASCSVGGFAMPPMRPKLCVRRAPVSCSRMSQIQSRTFTSQRNGVNAPSSIAVAPLQVRWSQMRASSPSTVR